MNQLGRGALRATIRAGNRDVHVIVCHLKSKLLTFPEGRFVPKDEGERARFAAYALYRRTAEAATLRSHLNGLLQGTGANQAVLLAGDLNDDADAATTQILNGPPGSEIGTVGYDRADQGDADRMWNLAPLIPEDERFTRRYRGRGELIDHIFVSHHLVKRAVAVHTLAATPQLPSITDDPRERRGEPGSDHAAVVARFDLDG
jgi:endonuclease/exonuclease/phosphatase family metal-dependent hydrolase